MGAPRPSPSWYLREFYTLRFLKGPPPPRVPWETRESPHKDASPRGLLPAPSACLWTLPREAQTDTPLSVPPPRHPSIAEAAEVRARPQVVGEATAGGRGGGPVTWTPRAMCDPFYSEHALKPRLDPRTWAKRVTPNPFSKGSAHSGLLLQPQQPAFTGEWPRRPRTRGAVVLGGQTLLPRPNALRGHVCWHFAAARAPSVLPPWRVGRAARPGHAQHPRGRASPGCVLFFFLVCSKEAELQSLQQSHSELWLPRYQPGGQHGAQGDAGREGGAREREALGGGGAGSTLGCRSRHPGVRAATATIPCSLHGRKPRSEVQPPGL